MLPRILLASLLLGSAVAVAEDVAPSPALANAANGQAAQRRAAAAQPAAGKPESGAKTLSGMSILGNQEAPKSLVIVPWKSSRIGDTLGMAQGLDDSRQPVDKEVFMRELAYYEIRSQ